MIRVLIADDHDVVRSGLRHLVDAQPNWQVVATGMAVAWPIRADTQQASRKEPPVVGYLTLGRDGRAARDPIAAFQAGLAALGYVQDQNIRVVYRFADSKVERHSEITTYRRRDGAHSIIA